MAERTKLTEKVLRESVPIVGRDYQIFDTDVRGFAACIYRSGGRAFTLDYRHVGRQRQLSVPGGAPWLFPGDTPGQPVQEVRRFWAQIQKQCALQDVRIHDLRHTFASLLVSGGASLEMIGKLLGHSQTQTTLLYAHLMESPLRPGVDAVASVFRPKPRLVHGADEPRDTTSA